MAKSFSSIKKDLGLLDFIPIGKYKQCRVDSIIEQDSDYLIYMDKEKILKFAPEVIERLMKKFCTDSIEVKVPKYMKYYPDSFDMVNGQDMASPSVWQTDEELEDDIPF